MDYVNKLGLGKHQERYYNMNDFYIGRNIHNNVYISEYEAEKIICKLNIRTAIFWNVLPCGAFH
jgi:hypothetical protein